MRFQSSIDMTHAMPTGPFLLSSSAITTFVCTDGSSARSDCPPNNQTTPIACPPISPSSIPVLYQEQRVFSTVSMLCSILEVQNCTIIVFTLIANPFHFPLAHVSYTLCSNPSREPANTANEPQILMRARLRNVEVSHRCVLLHGDVSGGVVSLTTNPQ